MIEQAGLEPGLNNGAQDSGVTPAEVAGAVVPPQQRMAMPVQRLEPVSLRRLFGAPDLLAPARIPAPVRTNEH